MTDAYTAAEHEPEHQLIPIFIDHVKYDAPSRHLTGAQLKSLPVPPVADDRDLWLEVPGPKDDELVDHATKYEMKPGSHYYTAPKTINPGADGYAVACQG
jgi:hypothetical protein